jgi:hypothetical protein
LQRQIDKSRYPRLDELRRRAQELSGRISSSYSLQATIAPEIVEVQNELLAAVQQISPARADSLRTMLHRLNENHLACLIHVSERTYSLVFVEFVRQALEFLANPYEDPDRDP